MDISLAADNLIWAINDNGHGPFIYALRIDSRSMGRVLVTGAQNRDWEGLDTFPPRCGESFILTLDKPKAK